MAKAKGNIKSSVKRKPIKSGSTNKGGNGGILNNKTIQIVTKIKNKKKNG